MSVKKLLVLGAATVAVMGATVAMAGGPDHMAMASAPGFENSVYVDLHGGWAQSNWDDFNANNVLGVNSTATSVFNVDSRGDGYWTAGADLGYNITQHIAVEAGWFYIPKVGGTALGAVTPGTITTSGSASVKSWFAYTAAKLSVPVMDNFDLFGKIGVAYRTLDYSLSNTATVNATTLNSVTGNGHYWAPVFGAGLQYNWGNWMLGAQYMFLPANTKVNYANTAFGAPDAAPAVNLYTGFVGYKFNV